MALNGRTHARGLQILAMHQHQEVLCLVIDMVVSSSDLAIDKDAICNRETMEPPCQTSQAWGAGIDASQLPSVTSGAALQSGPCSSL